MLIMEFKSNWLRFFLLGCAVLVFIIGTLGLVGYAFRLPVFYNFDAGISINPFTALAFSVIGFWMMLKVTWQKGARLLYIPTLFVTGGIVTLKLVHLSGNLPHDIIKLSFLDQLNSQELFSGINPNSAFLLSLCCIVIFTINKKKAWLLWVADIVKIAGFLTAYLVFIGYIYNIESGLIVYTSTPMAINTVMGYIAFFTFAVVGFPHGPFLSVFDAKYSGGSIARKAIPFILIIPLLLGYLRLMGEAAGVFEGVYGTALHTAAMVLLILTHVYLLARRLNKEDHIKQIAEQRIHESEQKYRTLLSTIREGIVYYKPDGTVLFCNDGFAKLTGYEVKEIVGNSIFNLFIKEELQEKYRKRQEDRLHGISEIYEDSIRTKMGEYKWVSISATPVLSKTGAPEAALATLVDITEKKKQLEDIEAFSASAAHDLNAPLARIEMIAMLLVDTVDDQLDEENLGLLKAIAGITANMRGMLKDLLDFSRLGILGIKKDAINTVSLVRSVVTETKPLNEKATVIIGELPQLFGDALMLRQVFINLVGNALKYSSHKEAPVVEIGCFKQNNNDVIFIKDNGAGFSMQQYNKLFAAFQRLHIEFEGNGLGLPIVKRIIEKHGGKIWAEGTEGVGATFYFTLPQ